MAGDNRTDKVVVCVLRSVADVSQVLVFDHPQAGTQLVKGTVEPGEPVELAAVRELTEESGLEANVDQLQLIGRWDPGALAGGSSQWHIYALAIDHQLPDRWVHQPTGSVEEEQVTFNFRWLAVDNQLPGQLHELFAVPAGVVVQHHLRAFHSVSSWRQPEPPAPSPVRSALVEDLARRVNALGPTRLRVAIDGYTASGKTSLGHELASALRGLGRTTLQASLDDFKKPWRDAVEKGYDRLSGDGYYRNAPDFRSARRLLLEPAGPSGSGMVVLCAHDPLTGHDHRGLKVRAPDDAVLLVDSVFAFRPEYNDLWDFRIWLDISADLSLERAIIRDAEMEGGGDEGAAEAERLHRERYHPAERIYIAEVGPRSLADAVVDNASFDQPVLVSR